MTLYEELFQWIDSTMESNPSTHGSLLIPSFIAKDHLPSRVKQRLKQEIATQNRGLLVHLVSFSAVSTTTSLHTIALHITSDEKPHLLQNPHHVESPLHTRRLRLLRLYIRVPLGHLLKRSTHRIHLPILSLHNHHPFP